MHTPVFSIPQHPSYFFPVGLDSGQRKAWPRGEEYTYIRHTYIYKPEGLATV